MLTDEIPSSRRFRVPFQLPRRRQVWLAILLVLTSGIAYLSLVGPILFRTRELTLQVGDVAPMDFHAPADFSYPSKVLTEEARQIAEEGISPVYTSPDANIVRQQVEQLRTALDYISNVRADTNATQEEKLNDLAAMQAVQLHQETAIQLLNLSDEDWASVQQECISVLVQAMRGTIREDRLEEARRSIPALISLSLPENLASIVGELTAAFVAPNSFYSPELTSAAREAAREAVPPVISSYLEGETIVQRGDVITPASLEALTQMGLIEPETRWQELVSPALLVLLFSALAVLYLQRHPELTEDLSSLHIIAVFFILFLVGARLLIPGHAVLPYAYPLAAYGLLLVVFFNRETGLIFSLPLAILTAFNLPNFLELTLYFLIGSLFGMWLLREAHRLVAFLWAGGGIASASAAMVIALRLLNPETDWIALVTLAAVALFNAVISISLVVILQFALARLLGMTTPLHLMELSRPDHPLLQYILKNAPGTYQHSLQVANLAEQAAEAVDANPLLTRVGALYHDVGKAKNPHYYIENQLPGAPNPHNGLDPHTSSSIILRHVMDGLELARQYRLPKRIQQFITEHHGTLITRYQYSKALEAAGNDKSLVREADFQYLGPRPQSKETAILMLADGCEARVRAVRPQTEDELRQVIQQVITERMEKHQLDDTDLTLRDLNRLVDSFTASLRGAYHPRIPYPEPGDTTQPEDTPAAELEAAPEPDEHSD